MNKAELLWLWYDYRTETFDRSLPCLPEPHPDGAAAVVPAFRIESEHYARKVHSLIQAISIYHKVRDWEMQIEKTNGLREKISTRLERYEWIITNEPHLFAFITEYVDLMNTIQRPVEKEQPHNVLQAVQWKRKD